MDEPVIAMYVVTCQTAGCPNHGIALTVPADANSPLIICGPCGQQITEVTTATE